MIAIKKMPVIEPLFSKLLSSQKKINVVQGGGDAGKTVTILQAISKDLIDNSGWIGTVTAQDGPNLTGGALRAFQRYVVPYMEGYINQFNKTEKTVYFKNGSILEFKAFSDEQDARGSERDILFINEANSRTYDFFWQLQRKTRKKVYLDYNPTSAFFVHNKVVPGPEQDKQFKGRVNCFLVDHRHNPFLTPEQHAEYENIGDPDLFQVYSRGKVGKIKGLIYGHFRPVDGPPEVFDRIIWGADWGYVNDPTAITKIWCHGRDRYVKEISYEPGITANHVKSLFLSNGWQSGQMIYVEHDTQMINQLRVLGMPVYPAIKGPNSIAARISKVREFNCYYFDSPNLKIELENYKWVTAKDLRTGAETMVNVPVAGFEHLCVIGSTLVTTDKGPVRIDEIVPGDMVLTSQGFRPVLNWFDRGVKEVFRFDLFFSGKKLSITCTPDHQIKTNSGWLMAKELRPGHYLFLDNGVGWMELNSVMMHDAGRKGVYDITVDEVHEFFANGFIIKNCDSLSYAVYSDSFRYKNDK